MTALVDQQRLLNYQAGARSLLQWIEDQLRFGLANLEADPAGSIEAIAAQLTDAQLPGPAEALRGLMSKVGVDATWAEDFLHELGYWNLQCRLVLQPDRLEDYQLEGVLVNFGLRIRRATLEEQPPSEQQRWTCIGIEYSDQRNVYARRSFWVGEQPGLWAEQVDFQYGAPLPPSQIRTGDAGDFAVYVYPGGLPGRVLLPSRYKLQQAVEAPAAFSSLAAQQAANERLLASQPWRRSVYFAVSKLHVQLDTNYARIQDREGLSIQLPAHRDAYTSWQLLAVVGSDYFAGYGYLHRGRLQLLAVWVSNRLVSLT